MTEEEYFTNRPSTSSLLFANPELPTPGNTFTTVRLGDKWLAQNVGIGSTLYFFGVEPDGGPGEEFGQGELIGRFEGALESIPGALLSLNHDPAARTFPNVVGVLTDVYGADAVADALNGDMPVVTLLIRVEGLAS